MDRSECSILSGNKYTSWSFPKNGKFMMFSMCHCWSRTLQGRDKWTRTRRNWTPATMIVGNTRWKQFGTARSMQESQNQVTYQVSTIWCLGKGIQKKKIPGSQPQRSSTLESPSACSTRIILTSRQQLLLPSTPHHRWLDQQPGPPSLSNKSEGDRQDALRNAPNEVTRKRRQGRGDKEEATRKRQQGGIRVSVVLGSKAGR